MSSSDTLLRNAHSRLAPLALCLALAACGGAGGDGGTQPSAGAPTAVKVVTGDAQQGTVGEELPAALVARVVDAAGRGVPGQSVSFVVTEGGGHVYAGAAITNSSGVAQERWTLGTATGAQKLEARAVDPQTGDKLLFATFTATAVPGPIASLVKATGDAQTAAAGTQLPTTITVRGTDRYGNAVTTGNVTWSVASGGGSASPAQVALDAQGRAQTAWTLGATVGNQSLTATAGTNSVTFTAKATAPPPALRWAPMSSPTVRPLLDVWGTSATNVWAVGEAGTIVHYDGSAWASVQSGTTESLVRVWGTSASNVYAISASNATLLHFDGAGWAAVAAPPRTSAPATQQVQYWINSPTDALALLRAATGGDSVLHWDGTKWSTVLRDVPHATAIWMAPDGRAMLGQSEVGDPGWYYDGSAWHAGIVGGRSVGFSGKSFSDVFIIHNSLGNCCWLAHFNGTGTNYSTSATAIYSPYAAPWFVSDREVYAFNSSYQRLGDGSRGLLFRLLGDPSFDEDQGIFGNAMWGAPPSAIFVVGAGGRIYRRVP